MNDFILDENYDLAINNGDFVTGNSDEQNQNLLLLTNPGDWKLSPTVGVGIKWWLKDDDASDLLSAIKKEFQRDGMTVNYLALAANGTLNINANY